MTFSRGGFKQHYLEKFLSDHGFRNVYATQRAQGSDEDGAGDSEDGAEGRGYAGAAATIALLQRQIGGIFYMLSDVDTYNINVSYLALRRTFAECLD